MHLSKALAMKARVAGTFCHLAWLCNGKLLPAWASSVELGLLRLFSCFCYRQAGCIQARASQQPNAAGVAIQHDRAAGRLRTEKPVGHPPQRDRALPLQ